MTGFRDIYLLPTGQTAAPLFLLKKTRAPGKTEALFSFLSDFIFAYDVNLNEDTKLSKPAGFCSSDM